MLRGQLTYVETKEIAKKSGDGTFKVVKLADAKTFTVANLMISCPVPQGLKTGDIVDVKVTVESVGYRLYVTVTEMRKVA